MQRSSQLQNTLSRGQHRVHSPTCPAAAKATLHIASSSRCRGWQRKPTSLLLSSQCKQRQQGFRCRAAEPAADPAAGQISQQLIERMEGTLREELEADQVAVTDVYGDGRHVSIDVVSKLFEGQPSVKRQRMVYKAIWQELQDTVHAVDAMVTKTPAERSS